MKKAPAWTTAFLALSGITAIVDSFLTMIGGFFGNRAKRETVADATET